MYNCNYLNNYLFNLKHLNSKVMLAFKLVCQYKDLYFLFVSIFDFGPPPAVLTGAIGSALRESILADSETIWNARN